MNLTEKGFNSASIHSSVWFEAQAVNALLQKDVADEDKRSTSKYVEEAVKQRLTKDKKKLKRQGLMP